MNDNGPPPDHVVDDEPSPEPERRDARLEENIKSRSTWLRLLFMILFLALWSISRILVLAVVFWVLFTGDTNARLLAFGTSLATYSYQIISYLTYNTEEQPFPFSDWPEGPPGTSES
jgi:hypothetical protein